MSDLITISKEVYNKLIENQKFLMALKACGVDNWPGYEEAVRIKKRADEYEHKESE